MFWKIILSLNFSQMADQYIIHFVSCSTNIAFSNSAVTINYQYIVQSGVYVNVCMWMCACGKSQDGWRLCLCCRCDSDLWSVFTAGNRSQRLRRRAWPSGQRRNTHTHTRTDKLLYSNTHTTPQTNNYTVTHSDWDGHRHDSRAKMFTPESQIQIFILLFGNNFVSVLYELGI